MFTYAGLRTILHNRGISFSKLSRDTGITSNCAVDLNNDRPVGIDKLVIVCNYLDVQLSDIVAILPTTDA